MSEKAEGKGESSNSSVQLVKSEKIDGESSPKRIKLMDNVNDLKKMSKDSLLSKFQEQEKYIDHLEDKVNNTSNAGEITSLRESEEKLKFQQQESTRRENVLVMRLATKEQEMQELLTQIHDLKQAQNPAGAQLRSTLLDPAVNIVFQRMKSELDETKEKLEQAQNDLSAWKFTPDSVTGKKLMAKCRMLIQENQELGRQLSQGRVAQLEAELALQKKYSEELKTSQDELNEFVIQLDEEVEGMQSTILTLQQQLKGVKNELVEEKQSSEKRVEQIRILERNLDLARTQPPSPVEVEKSAGVEEMQCDGIDRTEGENLGSGLERMETECSNIEAGESNMKPEVRDSELRAVEPELENMMAENVFSSHKNVSSEEESAQSEVKIVITQDTDVLSKIGIANAENEMNNESETARCESGHDHLGTENTNISTENAKTNQENANQENAKINTEDATSRTIERVSPFSPAREPTVRKSSGTPPCSTTFSISQILGEPKRTPSPDIPPGGDAVVTKIPYIGGYTDSKGEDLTLRTDSSGLLNGDTKDGAPPLVT
ncbi:pre-mRNA-splicing regulator WTAP-like [Dendronephthya gigantea]|uniref:pre-mRNA-splicing regulator WTAP-like n=1 Tax=Dendronephthya gigantea TaxID=151771 RepID=UPI00106A0FCE|nr:pre-mRNA-splicing regulator WTAP-like [Dendronephthya gigantea]